MGAALDGFVDDDGYRALDALNELCESYGVRHREGHMHGVRLVPRTRANPTSLWSGTTTARRPGFEFDHLLAETSSRLTVTSARVTRVAKAYLTMRSSK